jgi:hypothetical protein
MIPQMHGEFWNLSNAGNHIKRKEDLWHKIRDGLDKRRLESLVSEGGREKKEDLWGKVREGLEKKLMESLLLKDEERRVRRGSV